MRVENVGFQEPIDIADFSSIVSDIYVQDDPETIWALREPLAALARNQELLLSEMLRCHDERVERSLITEQPTYFIIRDEPGWSLRITIWLPESRTDGIRAIENYAFAYDYPHDHNFDLLTTTLFGEGYETEVFEHLGIPSDVKVGDIVEAVSLGRRQLTPGTVFFYEGCKDVHIQTPVNSITLALNFLPHSPLNRGRAQYAYAIKENDQLEILGSPLSYEQREIGLLRLLAKVASTSRDSEVVLETFHAMRKGATNERVKLFAERIDDLVNAGSEALHSSLRTKIDEGNLVLKYNEVANLRRKALGG